MRFSIYNFKKTTLLEKSPNEALNFLLILFDFMSKSMQLYTKLPNFMF